MSFKILIGMETHVELLTESKIFCFCSTAFKASPNTHCCPTCMGLPGSMPSLNSEVLNLAIKTGKLTNCKISKTVSFDRKHYFYPDLPKGYQITQHKNPICKDGYIELFDGKKVRINNIHMEEDAGKLIYKDDDILIDYNRSGVPLLEIVSEPDINSSDEAVEYLKNLCDLLKENKISDCKMHEGSLRCDVNVSLFDEKNNMKFNKVEIKNINSFKYIKKAIDYEVKRQMEILNDGGKIVSETRCYNEKLKITEQMRNKELSSDYRYIHEPDLSTIFIK